MFAAYVDADGIPTQDKGRQVGAAVFATKREMFEALLRLVRDPGGIEELLGFVEKNIRILPSMEIIEIPAQVVDLVEQTGGDGSTFGDCRLAERLFLIELARSTRGSGIFQRVEALARIASRFLGRPETGDSKPN